MNTLIKYFKRMQKPIHQEISMKNSPTTNCFVTRNKQLKEENLLKKKNLFRNTMFRKTENPNKIFFFFQTDLNKHKSNFFSKLRFN